MALPAVVLTGAMFTLLGAAAERLASAWPADEASHRRPGPRTVALAIGAGLAGGAVAWRSDLPLPATLAYLVLLAPMVVLAATDLEQRRLPHLLLDPLIVGAALFIPFNPAVDPVGALVGAGAAVGFLGVTGLLIRGGVALGDLYLVVPIGTLSGWPGVFTAVFVGALLSAVVGIGLLATRRAGLRTYIPFGPFLIAGLVIALLIDRDLLAGATAVIGRWLALA